MIEVRGSYLRLARQRLRGGRLPWLARQGLRAAAITLADRLRSQICDHGPMPFEDYMAACLYDPEGGFFAAGPLRSVAGGDFLTSPEVSPWFGRIVALTRSCVRSRGRANLSTILSEVKHLLCANTLSFSLSLVLA